MFQAAFFEISQHIFNSTLYNDIVQAFSVSDALPLLRDRFEDISIKMTKMQVSFICLNKKMTSKHYNEQIYKYFLQNLYACTLQECNSVTHRMEVSELSHCARKLFQCSLQIKAEVYKHKKSKCSAIATRHAEIHKNVIKQLYHHQLHLLLARTDLTMLAHFVLNFRSTGEFTN